MHVSREESPDARQCRSLSSRLFGNGETDPPYFHQWGNLMRGSKKTGKRNARGFASMTLELRREIARKGGLSVPKEKRAFYRDREMAISAGRKGGKASPRPKITSTNVQEKAGAVRTPRPEKNGASFKPV